MAVPIDPLKREWVQVSDVNPALVSQLRSTLVAFLARDRDHVASLAGSGFIIAGAPDMALVLTAKHVLLEGVLRIQRPVPFHAGSALFLPKGSRIPSLAPDRLKVIWMGEQSAALMNVAHASFNDSTDVACCVIGTQELHTSPFVPTSIPLHTMVPSVGDVVQMVSLDKMVINELSPPTDSAGTGQMTSITTRVNVRLGTVTGDYPSGLRQYGWPCFTTSIPAEPGMSGGFVCLPIHGTTVAACGIVCADASSEDARSDNYQCGESVVACAWPALALRVPASVPSSVTTPTRTLLDMMEAGDMGAAVGGTGHIKIVDLGNGDCRVEMQNA